MYNNEKTHKSSMPALRHSSLPVSRTREIKDRPLFQKALMGSLAGLAASSISGCILMGILSGIAYSSADPSSLIPSMGLLSLLPSCFIGGFISTKWVGYSPLLCGILHSAVLNLIMLVLSLSLVGIASSGYSLWQSIILHTVCALFSILGAFAGNINRRTKPGKRRFGN